MPINNIEHVACCSFVDWCDTNQAVNDDLIRSLSRAVVFNGRLWFACPALYAVICPFKSEEAHSPRIPPPARRTPYCPPYNTPHSPRAACVCVRVSLFFFSTILTFKTNKKASGDPIACFDELSSPRHLPPPFQSRQYDPQSPALVYVLLHDWCSGAAQGVEPDRVLSQVWVSIVEGGACSGRGEG